MGYDKTNRCLRTKLAQKYPTELCRAIAEGVKRQKEWDRRDFKLLATVNPGGGSRGLYNLEGKMDGEKYAYSVGCLSF